MKLITILIVSTITTSINGSFSIEDFKTIFRRKIVECSLSTENRFFSNVTERCGMQLDGLFSCWPNTPVNTTLHLPCPKIAYYEINLVPRRCFANKTWEKVDYNKHCRKLSSDLITTRKQELLLTYGLTTQEEVDRENEVIRHQKYQKEIKYYCRLLDLTMCAVGFIILFVFISWDNDRIMLHRNLILSFFLDDVCILLVMSSVEDSNAAKRCSILTVVHLCFFLAQICWMFNEGFFQFRQFFFVFIEKTYLWAYFLFGWGFPFVWTFGVYFPIIWTQPPLQDFAACWFLFPAYKYNYIVYSPAFLLLGINVGIMAYLIWMIWSKLKAQKTGDIKTARKAARGFLICMFLLGGGYIFTLYGPADSIAFMYFRVLVQNIQGIMVCILHVFMSKEVQEGMKTKTKKFMNRHNITLSWSATKRSKDKHSVRTNDYSTKTSSIGNASAVERRDPKANESDNLAKIKKSTPHARTVLKNKVAPIVTKLTLPSPVTRPRQLKPEPRECAAMLTRSLTVELKDWLIPTTTYSGYGVKSERDQGVNEDDYGNDGCGAGCDNGVGDVGGCGGGGHNGGDSGGSGGVSVCVKEFKASDHVKDTSSEHLRQQQQENKVGLNNEPRPSNDDHKALMESNAEEPGKKVNVVVVFNE